jgi:hypothetical protein
MSMFVPLPATSGADRMGSNRGAGQTPRGNAVVMGRYTPRAGKQAKWLNRHFACLEPGHPCEMNFVLR